MKREPSHCSMSVTVQLQLCSNKMKSIYSHGRKERRATTLKKYALTTLPYEIASLGTA